MSSLDEDLPKEQERCREILRHAIEIGPPGMFLVAILKADLAEADAASASGDVVGMIRAYMKLKGYKE